MIRTINSRTAQRDSKSKLLVHLLASLTHWREMSRHAYMTGAVDQIGPGEALKRLGRGISIGLTRGTQSRYFDNNIRSLVLGMMLFAFLFGSTLQAMELRPPRLIVSDVQVFHGWCGVHHIVYLKDDILIWRDFLSRRQLVLSRKEEYVRILGCSADGRWLLIRNGGYFAEGHDPDCHPFRTSPLPRLILWDSQEYRSYLVGRGEYDFHWAPKDAVFLYHASAFCGLAGDRRSWFKLPPELRGIQALDVRQMLVNMLPPNNGWYGGHIGINRWVSSERFIIELAKQELDGDGVTDSIPGGAIVAVTLAGNDRTNLQQLNPPGFVPSWRLPIPQVGSGDSDALLKVVDCKIDDHLNAMYCDAPRLLQDVHSERIDPDLLGRLCEAGRNEVSMCKLNAASLRQSRRKPYTLAFRNDGTGGKFEIFLIETDVLEKSE